MISFRKWFHHGDALSALCLKRDRAVKANSAAADRATDAALTNLEQSQKAYEAVADLLKRMETRHH